MLRLFDLRLLAPAAIAAAGIAAGLAGMGGTTPPAPVEALAAGLSVDGCVQVKTGDTFEVNILVADVTDILAWDVLYAYNSKVVEVTDRDVRQIIEALPNSNVFDLSDPVPNSVGSYRMGAADTGGTDAAESGSGTLATLTLRAKSAGLSWSAVYRADVNGDGSIDIGPTLTALGGRHIGDTNGDSVFDGTIANGQIAVDEKCTTPQPTAPPPVGVVVVDPPGETPTIQPASSDVPSPGTPTPTAAAPETGTPTPTPTRVIAKPPPSGGDSGPTLSTWLIGLLAGSVAIGVVLSYAIYRTARRPA